MLLEMALAAMMETPNMLTMPATMSLPIWNMLFSNPLGMPWLKMRRIMGPSGSGRIGWMRWMGAERLSSSHTMMPAPSMRASSDAVPAPATSMFRP